MKRRALSFLTLILCGGTGSSAVGAGGFQVTDTAYVVWPLPNNDEQIRIQVEAQAKYRGKLDREDENAAWIINTHLNTTTYWERNSPLDNWEEAQFTGNENTSLGVPESGFVIECSIANGCAVDASIDKCDFFDRSHLYRGHGAAGIYHHGGADEFDQNTLSIEETECLTYEVGGSVSGIPADPPWSLILQNNSFDNLDITANGSFAFQERLRDGETFSIDVIRQPFSARCSADPQFGTVEGEDVVLDVPCIPYCEARYTTIDHPAGFAEAGAVACTQPASLVDLGDGTVADFGNNLLWTKQAIGASGGSATWSAGEHCGGLVLAGRDDWRVPDIAQLQTLLPPGTCQSAMDDCGVEAGWHWSRSKVPYDTYCGQTAGCPAHSWAAALGAGDDIKVSFCYLPGCPEPDQRVWWCPHDAGGYARCVTSLLQ